MNKLEVSLFKNSKIEFLKMLNESNIEYQEIQHFEPEVITNSGSSIVIDILNNPWIQSIIVGFVVNWISSKITRTATIQVNVNITVNNTMIFNSGAMTIDEFKKKMDEGFDKLFIIDTDNNK